MRQTITGLVVALAMATASAAPAMACGYNPWYGYVSPCVQAYVPAYTYAYTGCGACGGWTFERLAEPSTQYYYVNQGPTYTGPGAFAPYRTYYEGSGPYRPYYYGYRHHWRHGYRYGHVAYHHPVRYGHHTYHGHRVLRRAH
ncbi:MAG: hypothetical protein ACREDL_19305 [Bradyrhizobium sp.]